MGAEAACACVRGFRGGCHGRRAWLSGTGSDFLYPVPKANSAVMCSPVQGAERFKCTLENPELVLNK